MQLQHAWEHNLLALALEALHFHSEHPNRDVNFEDALLENAYGYCESLTAVNSRSFHLASNLLPYDKRRAPTQLGSRVFAPREDPT